MTEEELVTERNEVREILADFSEELSQANLNELSRVFCLINGDEKRIADLEKENAELKKQQFSLRNERNTFLAQNEQYEKDLIDLNEQLTKAKDLLAKWVELYKPKLEGYPITTIQEQTEQFISEVEK